MPSNPSDELIGRDGLREVVVRPDEKPGDPVEDFSATLRDEVVFQTFAVGALSSCSVFGPFPDGTKIKLTHAPGSTPDIKPG